MSEPHVIAFDIDGTWTLNPQAWLAVYEFLTTQGFTCLFVTGAEQPVEKLARLLIPEDTTIIVASGILKRDAARKAGYGVAVWIDDLPGTIEPCRILTDSPDL